MNSHGSSTPVFSRENCNLAPQERVRLEQISQKIKDLGVVGSRTAEPRSDELFDFAKMAELLSIYYQPQLTSHRPWLGPLIVFAKRFFLRFFNKWLMISLVKQKELNHMLFDVALTVQTLERRIQTLENQLKGQA